jgi:hypothetical protein
MAIDIAIKPSLFLTTLAFRFYFAIVNSQLSGCYLNSDEY